MMLVQPQLQGEEETQKASQSDLERKILDILHSFSQRGKTKDIYLHAAIDSMVGFKIQLNFTQTHLFVKGSLIYSNGGAIFIPEVYLDMISQKLQQQLEISLRFQYVKESSTLVFQSGLKLTEDVREPIPYIIQHIKVLVLQLPKVYQQLVIFGIVKKLNLKYSKLISKKLWLISNVVNTLKLQESETEAVFSSGLEFIAENKGSVFKYFKQIQEVDARGQTEQKNLKLPIAHSSNMENFKRSGYFEVQKQTCKITESHQQTMGQSSILELAVKKPRKDQQNVANYQNKLDRQLRILYQIQNPSHSLNYWVKEGSFQDLDPKTNDKIYMEYIQDTLDDCIYCKQNNIKDIIEYSKQLVKAVEILQKSGVVHRDLKPDNLLVQNYSKQNKQIKIIDFGESSLKKDTYSKKPEDALGSTLPYSPIQCYLSCQQGYNSCQIDLWSVGLILYQIMHRKNPITYSRCFSADIYKGWRLSDQFSIYPNLRRKDGLKIIFDIFSILAMNSVCVDQKSRISLHKMKNIINFLNKFVTEVQEL